MSHYLKHTVNINQTIKPMFQQTPQNQISPLTLFNDSTDKKPAFNRRNKYIVFDDKENINVNNEHPSNHFSLDFKEEAALRQQSTLSSPEYLSQKRKRLRKLSQTEATEMLNKVAIKLQHRRADDYKTYTDKEYQSDLMSVLKDKKHFFMYSHFPFAYGKQPFYFNIRSKPKMKNYIKPNLIKLQLTGGDLTALPPHCRPIKKWSPSSLLCEDFLDQLEEKWDNSIADFRIETILEFVMINKYSWAYCLENAEACADYVRRCQELLNDSIKPKEKRYRLRKHKKFNHGVFNNDHYEYFY